MWPVCSKPQLQGSLCNSCDSQLNSSDTGKVTLYPNPTIGQFLWPNVVKTNPVNLTMQQFIIWLSCKGNNKNLVDIWTTTLKCYVLCWQIQVVNLNPEIRLLIPNPNCSTILLQAHNLVIDLDKDLKADKTFHFGNSI